MESSSTCSWDMCAGGGGGGGSPLANKSSLMCCSWYMFEGGLHWPMSLPQRVVADRDMSAGGVSTGQSSSTCCRGGLHWPVFLNVL